MSEHLEQAQFVQWFRRTYPDVLIFAIPNGGARSIATAGKLKSEGVVAGIPDLFIPAWHTWIEMKRTKGGRVSPSQKKVMDYLYMCGFVCIIAHGCNDAIEKIGVLKK